MAAKNPPRKKIPRNVETAVLAKSARRCALCFYLTGDRTEKLGQIAHLDEDRTNRAEDNLAWMCLPHHSLYDSKTSQHKNYTIEEVKAARSKLYALVAAGKHLAPAALKRRHRPTEIMAAVRDELRELQYMMAVVAYRIRGYSGAVTDAFLDWLIPIVRSYHGPEEIASLPGALEESRKLAEEMRRRVHLDLRRPGAGLGLKEYFLPLIAAMASEISICPLPFQRGVMRIVNRLDRFNQHVAHLRSQFDKTFDPGIVGENRDAVLSNLDRGYIELAEMAKTISAEIAAFAAARKEKRVKGKVKDRP
jgi:hypothetical protein